MTIDTPPWEPPLAGTEREQLFGALNRLRMTFRYKTDGLDTAGLQAHIGASPLTLGALLKHLAVCEDYASTVKLSGAPMPASWEQNGWGEDDDWEFTSAVDDSPADLYARYDAAVSRSVAAFEQAADDGGFDGLVHVAMPDGRHANLRRLICDMIEEYGRHTGQADLLREAVDGRVGEDPADGWLPPDWSVGGARP
jgi:hypothetical protein